MKKPNLTAGTRVKHRIFGEGTVVGDIENADANQRRVVVDWDNPCVSTVSWWYWDFFDYCDLEIIQTFGI